MNVILVNRNEYQIDEYLDKLSKRIFAILYLYENEDDNVKKYIENIGYEMLGCDNLLLHPIFFSYICEIFGLVYMVNDNKLDLLRKTVLDIGNGVKRLNF